MSVQRNSNSDHPSTCSCGGFLFTQGNLRYVRHELMRVEAELSEQHLSNLQYGYPKGKGRLSRIRKLQEMRHGLSRLKCLKACSAQRQVENAMSAVGISSCAKEWTDSGLTRDHSGYDAWVAVHPDAIPREKYELMAFTFCQKLDINLKVLSKEDACQLFYDFSKENLDQELLFMITSYRKDCQINPGKLKVTKKDCNYELEFKVMQDKLKSCDLTLGKFTHLRQECNIPLELIYKSYSCGLRVDIDPNKQSCPVIDTGLHQYNLCSTLFNLSNAKNKK